MSETSGEDLINSFEFIGQKPSNDVIKKCLQICSSYCIDAEELVEHWSAFSMTYLKDSTVSLDSITLMEQRSLSKKKSLHSGQKSNDSNLQSDTTKKLPSQSKKPDVQNNVSELEAMPDHKNEHTEHDIKEEVISQISYADRSNSERVVISFGKNHDCIANNQPININIHGNSWYNSERFTALYTTQGRIASCFDSKIDTIGRIILKRNNLDLSEREGNIIVYGRIKSEDRNKVNNKSVVLETPRDFNGPKEIVLNIASTQSYSIFSGQVVAVRGVAVSRNILVQEIYNDAPPEFTSEAPSFNENLQIVVAAGPFTTSDNFLYEPLQDLLKRVVQQKPNVLLLIGPFIDTSHSNLSTMTETFESYFDTLIQNIMDCLVGWPIQVVLIPSSADAHHFPVYPTPCYELKHYQNLTCAPNPCLLDVNGLIIGTASADILFQLSKEEISKNVHNDRMTRLASHILNQRSFFPLYPNRDTSLSIDYERLYNDCTMDVKPHLLILPSTLRYFVKNVNNCLVINPERLVRNHVGGTYATINVSPTLEQGNIINCISCQLKNI